MDAQQFPDVAQQLVDPNAGRVARILPQKAQVAAGNLNAIGDLSGDPFEVVLGQLQLFALDLRLVANVLVDKLKQAGNDGERPVNIVDDAGINLASSPDDLLL